MWTGSKALNQIDKSLKGLRQELMHLDTELDQMSSGLANDERRRLKLVNEIAKIRLSEIERGGVLSELDAADKAAKLILEQRAVALETLDTNIEQHHSEISQKETIRQQTLTEYNSVSQQLDDLERSVQASLGINQEYLAQLEKARKAESIAEEAALKVEQAQADLGAKAAPYQADELFMYLWSRGFGTTQYSAGLFARFMDSWVARVIDYEPARQNFWNLTEIPQRLAEHAERVAHHADEEHMNLQQIELDALVAAGKADVESALEKAQVQLDEVDDKLAEIEQDLNDDLSERARFVAGEDSYIQRCLSTLSSALENQDLYAVHRYVQQTASPTDDQLLIELQGLNQRSDSVKTGLSDVRKLHNNKFTQLKDLEGVRRNFKNARFDDVRSAFSNQTLIASVLGQFLQGLVSGADLWNTIKKNQRYRDTGALPDFGSGGLGEIADVLGDELLREGRRRKRRRGSSWHWPRPRAGKSGGFRLPSGGGSGGGFRVPSGGGGGFKTGGGF